MHYIILIDNSYSMLNHIEKLVLGLNNFVKTIRNSDCFLTVISFSNNTSFICKETNIKNVIPFEKYQFNKLNSTSLYDAIYETISFYKHTIMKNQLFIITDGEDNTSVKYTKNDVDFICQEVINSGFWNIIHCHTDVSNLKVDKNIIYNIDDIGNIFEKMMI